jgi:eukaryotic-like serine/threonine-protein kinase
MATVLLGRKDGVAGFERIVAIKCCHPHLRSNHAFRKMFLDEARLAARIHHPNVVATLDVSDGDPLYLVMEYVDGESVAALQRVSHARGASIPLEITMRVMIDSLSGLHAAHECRSATGELLGLVHCDVSPQNILVGLDGVTRIVDFGIARAAAANANANANASDGSTTTDGKHILKGKVAYMAREQLLSRAITRQTDVFGAGVVLWEMLTSRRLFQREDESSTIQAALLDPIQPPSKFAPSGVEIPEALDAVVLRALRRERSSRFETAADFLTALEKIPIAPATPRAASEYMREIVMDTTIAARRTSLSRRQAEVRTPSEVRAQAPTLDAEDSSSIAATAAATGEGVDANSATRIVAPPPKLLAQTRNSLPPAFGADSVRPPSATMDSMRPPSGRRSLRGVVVAVTILLLGCGIGLLFANGGISSSSSAPPPRPSTGVSR